MREKIARAIYHSKPRNRPYELLGQHARQYEKQADAVLDALMEPSNDMLEAMFSAMFDAKFTGAELPMMGAGFEAAIQAAKDGK